MKKKIEITEKVTVEDFNEDDLKEAVCFYLNTKHKLNLKPDNVEFDSVPRIMITRTSHKEPTAVKQKPKSGPSNSEIQGRP